jgi:hypothetical protein
VALRRISRLWRIALAAVFAFALVHAVRVRKHHAIAHASLIPRPAPLPLASGDEDRDGLSDELEAELADRFAPIVILHPQDGMRPASISWLLSHFGPLRAAQNGLPAALRTGSSDPRDWVTYVHVYPRTDGDINIQYWFFYAYNQTVAFFDHDADWEHVTVVVSPSGHPRGVSFAQHGDCSPGAFRAWSNVRKDGDHPIVLSARGTHASYPDQASVSWFDRVSRCQGVDGCHDPIWRTNQAGGMVNLGERRALLGSAEVRDAMAFGGLWGGRGRFLVSRAAPRGPSHQHGFAVDGYHP